jgi:hypothetical protein
VDWIKFYLEVKPNCILDLVEAIPYGLSHRTLSVLEGLSSIGVSDEDQRALMREFLDSGDTIEIRETKFKELKQMMAFCQSICTKDEVLYQLLFPYYLSVVVWWKWNSERSVARLNKVVQLVKRENLLSMACFIELLKTFPPNTLYAEHRKLIGLQVNGPPFVGLSEEERSYVTLFKSGNANNQDFEKRVFKT